MSKGKVKSKAAHGRHRDDAPQPEQLAAVRRQLERGHLGQARQQCAALRQAFPRFRPLYELGFEIELFAEQPMLAAARAWEWHQAAPHSDLALESMAEAAQEAGLMALMTQARLQLQRRDLDEGEPAPPVPDKPIDTPLGPLTFEQAVALDLGRMHLGDGHHAAAIEVLRGVEHPSARNNQALALFGSGDVRGAQAMAEAAWREHPENLFALERSLRWRCWFEGMAPVRGLAATLRASVPRRVEDACARVSALRFLGDTEGVAAAWADSADLDFWEGASPEQIDLFESLRLPEADLPGDATLWLPSRWTREIAHIASTSKPGSEGATQARLDAHFDALDAHTDYLVRACEIGDKGTRFLALSVLKRRALRDDNAARQAVVGLLVGLGGPDEDRMGLLRWLDEHGLHDPAAPVPMRTGATVRDIRSVNLRITSEPRPSPLSKEGQALAKHMLKELHRGAQERAVALGRQLRDLHPTEPMALGNLAGALEALDGSPTEIAALYREALALNPDYFFARCGLARCLAAEGRTDEARAQIDGLMEREEMHVSEYRRLLAAQRAIAQALGEHEAVQAMDRALRELQERFG